MGATLHIYFWSPARLASVPWKLTSVLIVSVFRARTYLLHLQFFPTLARGFFVGIMSFKILALVTSLLACITEGTDVKGFTVGGYTPAAFRAPSPNTVTSNTLSLTRKSGSRSAAYLQSIRKNTQVNGLYQYGVAPLTQEEEGEEYLTEIEFGSKSFSVILDTGSSDTWLVETGFTCVNQTSGALETEAECMFGPTYTVPSTFKDIPDENFNITYGNPKYPRLHILSVRLLTI